MAEAAVGSGFAQFPFQLKGFHSDNGSEFINRKVAGMLQKLFIEQTKSRPRHSNDNGLVESKNGAVVRKHMGYLHIEAQHAEPVQSFYREHLNPYLNFHRPCGQAEIETDGKGKQKRVYRRWQRHGTSCASCPDAARYLRPGQTMEELQRARCCETDTEAATGCKPPKQSYSPASSGRQASNLRLTATRRGKTGHGKGGPRCPQPLEIAPRFPHSHRPDYDWTHANNEDKPNRKEIFSHPRLFRPPGSSLDWKMLSIRMTFWLGDAGYSSVSVEGSRFCSNLLAGFSANLHSRL